MTTAGPAADPGPEEAAGAFRARRWLWAKFISTLGLYEVWLMHRAVHDVARADDRFDARSVVLFHDVAAAVTVLIASRWFAIVLETTRVDLHDGRFRPAGTDPLPWYEVAFLQEMLWAVATLAVAAAAATFALHRVHAFLDDRGLGAGRWERWWSWPPWLRVQERLNVLAPLDRPARRPGHATRIS